jgi:hypothetical protein
MGSPNINIYEMTSKDTPEFRLYSGSEWSTIMFPVEPSKQQDLPSFMSGQTPTRKVESLDLNVSLEGQQLEFQQRVDAWVKRMAQANSKEWFGRQCGETEVDLMYTSPLRIDESGRYAPKLRVKFNLSGIEKFLTQVNFRRDSGTWEEGVGWDFVQQRLGEDKWFLHRARLVLEARRIWIVGRKFGLTYSASHIAVREKPRQRSRPFAHDNTMEDDFDSAP